MEEKTPDLYSRISRLIDNWKRERRQVELAIRERVEEGTSVEWLVGMEDCLRTRRYELEAVLRGNCPPKKVETKMLHKGSNGGGGASNVPTKGYDGKPPPPFLPFGKR